jgi:phosphatidyl-myo-inositol dimannoside synthase
VEPVEVPRTLVVTNDFPPRVGGVQQYVSNLVANLPSDRVAVVAPTWPGSRDHDEARPFAVHRWPARSMVPTEDLARRVRGLAREHGADVVLFGHGFPLPLLGPGLRRAGWPFVVLTHGAEVWQARTPGVAAAMRWSLRQAAQVTAIAETTAGPLRRLLAPHPGPTILTPGVDAVRFRPDADGSAPRRSLGLDSRPTVLCVSRLVRRKGQDVLIEAIGIVQRTVPDAVLVLVGGGADEGRLREMAEAAPPGSVVFAGERPDDELPALYAGADLFAMPCRSRWGGLEVEGFGIVFLEAAAAGRAVVAGRSGGAEEAVQDERTGLLVEGGEPKAVALAVSRLLRADDQRDRMGRAGRDRVEASFTWPRLAARLAEILRRAAG